MKDQRLHASIKTWNAHKGTFFDSGFFAFCNDLFFNARMIIYDAVQCRTNERAKHIHQGVNTTT